MAGTDHDGHWAPDYVHTGEPVHWLQRLLTGGAYGLRNGAVAGVLSEVTVALVAAFAIEGTYAPMLGFVIVGAIAGGGLGLLLGPTPVTPTSSPRSAFAALTAAPAIAYGMVFALGMLFDSRL